MKPSNRSEIEAEQKRQFSLFLEGCRSLDIGLSQEQQRAFFVYLGMLLDVGRGLNLYSAGDRQRLAQRHLLESIAWLPEVSGSLQPPVLDLGSGAGFPGIPMAILFPGWKVALLESKRKKAIFLESVVRELRLDAKVYGIRAEELARRSPHSFGTVVARAVAPLKSLLQLTGPLLQANGLLVTFKGDRLSEEVAAIRRQVESGEWSLEIKPFVIGPGLPQKNLVLLRQERRKYGTGSL